MKQTKSKLWSVSILIILAASSARGDVVTFTLDNVVLDDGEQIFGVFDWTFVPGDFEGGTGEFVELDIPYTIYSLEDGNLDVTIEASSIEISGNGNYHDIGLDISFDLPLPLAPTQPAPIDLDTSFFECCGNGFKDQFFASGSITPLPEPSAFWLYASSLATLQRLSRRRRSRALCPTNKVPMPRTPPCAQGP